MCVQNTQRDKLEKSELNRAGGILVTINNHMRTIETFSKVETLLVRSDGFVYENCVESTICEHFMDVFVNGQFWLRLACTPNELVELVVGRLISERIIDTSVVNALESCIKSIEVCEDGSRAEVYLANDKGTEHLKIIPLKSNSAIENERFMTQLSETDQEPSYHPEWIFTLTAAFLDDSQLHKATKGTHSCYLSIQGKIIYSAEDIGRHNALDKAIGYAALNNYSLHDCILFTTGRVSVDMVMKVATARIPILVSKAVPTTAAITLATRYGITLIGRAWQDSYEVYIGGKL